MTARIICIANQKGGVGKTTTAVSLAHGLSQQKRRVLLIDLDPQGQSAIALGRNPEPGVFHLLTMRGTPQKSASLNSWMRFSGREGLYLFPGDQQTTAAQTVLSTQERPISAIRNSVSRFFKDGMHYIIFDTASSVGAILERAVWASDLVIVPTATEFLSTDGVPMILHMMSALQGRKNWRGSLLGVLPTFYDEQSCESRAMMDTLLERFQTSLLPPIHHSALLRECAARGQTIFETEPLSCAAREYLSLVQLVMKY
jgi:chromosome partitioning protein